MAQFTENAMTILEARYLRKDNSGKIIETPEGMLHRVADALANDNDKKRQKYFDMMNRLDFLPNTPTLINAGRKNGQLSACFVLPIEDSMDGIFTTIKNAATIHKTGGGTGFAFSRLRSKGERVSTTGGEASGVISFLNVFNAATDSVKQGGVRRGANMGMLRIDHPDIEEFIMCKDDTSKLTNFNLSIGITDEFMEAVYHGRDWPLVDPHSRETHKVVNALALWKMIIHQAWKNGEPGVIFLDAVNRSNPTPELGEIEATNPCGEQPLLPYESCNLGSINLSNHIVNGRLNIDKLAHTVFDSVDFLNSVLDCNTFPMPEIKENTLRTRKIGLGVMGFADMLLKMRIKYSSEEAVKTARFVMEFIQTKAHEHSEGMGYNNATCTTIAPTGTISMLANVSSGIEPNFSWVYTRNSCDRTLYIVHPLMEEKLREIGQFNEEVLHKLGQGIPVVDIREIAAIGDFWQLSQEIKPECHIGIQAAFQQFTDNAVSKTINLPNTATEDDVHKAYTLAYESGCKGVTVYRDGSRDSQVLNFEKVDGREKNGIRERPESVDGTTSMKKIGCGKLYVTVNKDDDGPIEVFTNTGKQGGCPAQSEGLSRMVSIALQYGVPVEAISKQLCGIRCMSTIRKDGCNVLSCPDAIGRSLRESSVGYKEKIDDKNGGNDLCPECGQPIEQSEGCVICRNCGYSKCM